MVHRDHETRVMAHRIFSVVLVPSSVAPRQYSAPPMSGKAAYIPRSLSRTVSVFSSSAALFEKLRKERSGSKENIPFELGNNNGGMLDRLKSSYSRASSIRNPVHVPTEESSVSNLNKEVVGSIQILSFHVSPDFLYSSFVLYLRNLGNSLQDGSKHNQELTLSILAHTFLCSFPRILFLVM